MTKTRLLAAAPLAALFVLSACQSEPVVVGQAADPQAEALAKATPKQLPPSIKEEETYRCRDNSLVRIRFMSDNVTAYVLSEEGGAPSATLTAPAPGEPFVAEGYSLSGSGSNITFKSPDTSSQTCRA